MIDETDELFHIHFEHCNITVFIVIQTMDIDRGLSLCILPHSYLSILAHTACLWLRTVNIKIIFHPFGCALLYIYTYITSI